MRIPTSKQDKGFTLIELLVVVVIIGILAAVAIPVFLNQRQKAADSNTKSDLKNAATVMETYFVDDQTYDNVSSAVLAGLLKESKNVVVTVESANASGYCLKAANSGGSGDFFYDSGAGGLQDDEINACPTVYN